MTLLSLATALALTLLGAPPPAPDPALGHVSGLPVTAGDLRAALGDAPPTRASLAAALDQVIAERLLAAEAHAQLGERARQLPLSEAARLFAARVFDPAQRCGHIPEPLRRQHYAETVWRFVAPPAYRVQDLQLLCCKDPRRCDTPEVGACLDATEAGARALRGELPATADLPALQQAFERLRERHAELYLKTYTFYYDAERPEAPVHARLQTVDAPIARAGAALAPGELSPVVRTRFGHHVLRLDAVRPGVALPFDDPRTQALLRTELCPAYLLTLRQQVVADLRANAAIDLDKDALRAAFPEL